MLKFTGQVNTTGGSKEHPGVLLLDPTDIDIRPEGSAAENHDGYLPFVARTDGDVTKDAYGRILGAFNPTGVGTMTLSASAILDNLQHSDVVVAATNDIQVYEGFLAASENVHHNELKFRAGNTLTLSAITGSLDLITRGKISLQAEEGISVSNNVRCKYGITINSDYNNDGSGTLIVTPNMMIETTENRPIVVTAADIDLDGEHQLCFFPIVNIRMDCFQFDTLK